MIQISSENQRKNMVDSQLIPRGIANRHVLDAFYSVPREFFVSPDDIHQAYEDCPLPIGHGQTISQPYMAALMTELIYRHPPAKMLDVGTGSGYQAAILARLGFSVISIERLDAVANFAKENFERLNYCRQINVIVGDGTLGMPGDASFDGILISAASPKVPPSLAEQLAPGGKLVIPCGDLASQKLLVLKKDSRGQISVKESIGCRFVPLIGKDAFHDIA
jgi:protein-L-isoaspartate(D-aspartate) O-methyltransferase